MVEPTELLRLRITAEATLEEMGFYVEYTDISPRDTPPCAQVGFRDHDGKQCVLKITIESRTLLT